MPIKSLGYLGVRSNKVDDWKYFAGKVLAMHLADHGGRQLSFRMDDLVQRLVVSDEPGETLAFIGWEVSKKSDLQYFAAKLDDAGHKVTEGGSELADRRFVEDLIVCSDPAGNRIELVWNPQKAEEPFIPGRPIDGFKTGPLGMGHAVLHVPDATALLPFYFDILGFAVSDSGLDPIPLSFFHVIGRHNRFALVGPGNLGVPHFMV